MLPKKDRADALLVRQGLAEHQDQASRLIMAGQVWLVRENTRNLVEKPGQPLPLSACLELKTERFVSRGGYKLASALEHFQLDVTGWTALDAGASTGGFTDCLLQAKAARVYAVDVGHNLLHEKLRRDPRVISLEGLNLRHAAPDLLPEKVDLIVADCSFISLRRILPPCMQFLKPDGRILALIKPQFELGPEHAIKGVVRSEKARLQAVEDVSGFARAELGLTPRGVVPAGVKGPKGNQEYMLYLGR